MYDEGLKDAWKLAEKIVFIDKNGGLTCKQFNQIFHNLWNQQHLEILDIKRV